VAAARHFVRDLLRDQPDGIVEAVELMTSELATNSVRHAHSDFELVVDDSRERVRVEVSDTGDGQPMLRSPTISERSGRGLRIVQALSDAWGSVPSTNGKMVWFTLSTNVLASERAPQSVAFPDGPDGSSDPSSEWQRSVDLREPGSPRDGPASVALTSTQFLFARLTRPCARLKIAPRQGAPRRKFDAARDSTRWRSAAAFGAPLRCRRRDSNPRHADYDRFPAPRNWLC
jgi:anti-sigma regulatory factor (Ser/Thr protein kinase)